MNRRQILIGDQLLLINNYNYSIYKDNDDSSNLLTLKKQNVWEADRKCTKSTKTIMYQVLFFYCFNSSTGSSKLIPLTPLLTDSSSLSSTAVPTAVPFVSPLLTDECVGDRLQASSICGSGGRDWTEYRTSFVLVQLYVLSNFKISKRNKNYTWM